FYYQAAPQLVGPVRSARPTDAELLAPFQPVLAVSGGVDFVLRELQAAGVTVVDEVTLSGAFQRLERPMPYNLMASFDIVAQQGGGVPPAGEPYPFGEGEFSGRPASRVAIPFSAATDLEYQYQEDQGGYLRLENGEPFTALPTFEAQPEPLILDTVVVQVVAQRSSGYTDASGSEVPTLDVIGFGPALIFHQGQVLEGEWRRAAQADGTLFFDEAGRALQLPPGRLIVELVPREVDVSWE
ncbi:MAG: DUF3048 C-terminal domain-containing protein, partial [Acidimicrobiia bacterium]